MTSAAADVGLQCRTSENVRDTLHDALTMGLEGIGAARTGRGLPVELLQDILRDSWLSVPLTDFQDRWELFYRVSLVSHWFRENIVYVAARYVRLLGFCKMDVAAYRSIGEQARIPHPELSLAQVFRPCTIYLDVSFVVYSSTGTPMREWWMKESAGNRRPDDYYHSTFNFVAAALEDLGVHTLTSSEDQYRAWLDQRRPNKFLATGWFARLLEAVPDCSAVVIESNIDEAPEGKWYNSAAYSMLLESLWWWPSLEALDVRVVPYLLHFPDATNYVVQDPRSPLLPPLPSVRAVWLARYPQCTCGHRDTGHLEDCLTRWMLKPFSGLRHLAIDEMPDRLDDVAVPPGLKWPPPEHGALEAPPPSRPIPSTPERIPESPLNRSLRLSALWAIINPVPPPRVDPFFETSLHDNFLC